MVDLRDRYRGVLLGLACGDALGGAVEFKSRAEIAQSYPGGLRDFVGGGPWDLAPGEITDDTQMTLAIARSLVAFPELNMDDIAARFVAWLQSDPKDIGTTTRAALKELARGVPWNEAAERAGGSAGNGSVMRCAPVALRFRADREKLDSASRDTARITHADIRCQWAAVAINRIIADLLDGVGLQAAVERAVPAIGEAETRDALAAARSFERDDVQSGGFVLHTMQAAIWSVARHDDAEAAIVEAVNLGDDSDTTGAVTGALAGAQNGASGLPNRWLQQVQYRDELTQLADRLLELSLG